MNSIQWNSAWKKIHDDKAQRTLKCTSGTTMETQFVVREIRRGDFKRSLYTYTASLVKTTQNTFFNPY